MTTQEATPHDIVTLAALRIVGRKRRAGMHHLALPDGRVLKWTPYIAQKPLFPDGSPTKQADMLAWPGMEALYGGAVGGGKSSALLMAALQYVDVPGYAALLLRKTYADLSLPGALMDRAFEWLSGTDARWNGQSKTWTFPSGATLTFGYLDNAQDKFRYQSSEFQFCVVRGTPVLMADGTWKPIESIMTGETVATLEGPREVTQTHALGTKPVCEVATSYGVATVGITHRLLLSSGAWVSPRELMSRQCLPSGNSGEWSWPTPRESSWLDGYLLRDHSPEAALAPQTILDRQCLGYGAWSGDDQSGFGAFDDSRGESLPPRMWYGHLALAERALQSMGLAGRDMHGVHHDAVPPGSPSGYRSGLHYDDAYAHRALAGVPGSTLLRDDVEAHTLMGLHGDGRGNIPTHSPQLYAHPYTKKLRSCSEGVRPVSAGIAPAGEAEVFDLTVSLASHYIVFPGIIAQNCGFDELTQFTESDYRYLFSRLRRHVDVEAPLRMRSGSNPGGLGHEWVKQRFVVEGQATGRAYFPARLGDNPYLDQEEYTRSLMELDPITRQQLLDGDWSARQSGGLFKREWFEIVNAAPAECYWVRYWDMAAAEVKTGEDPDWTAGALVGRSPAGLYYIADIQRLRESPNWVDARILQAAQTDSVNVAIWMEQEPGASGLRLIDYYRRKVLAGFSFRGDNPTSSKVTRAMPVSSQAEAGNVKLVRGLWIGAFLDEAEAFPNGEHDDQVDAVSGAMSKVYTGRGKSESVDTIGVPVVERSLAGLDPEDPRYIDQDEEV